MWPSPDFPDTFVSLICSGGKDGEAIRLAGSPGVNYGLSMAPDEQMVFSGMLLVPVVTGIASVLLLRAVRREAMSWPVSCAGFCAALALGMAASFAYVWGFSHLLHGDGALAIIAAPITGAIVSMPVLVVFVVALAVMTARRRRPDA